MSRSEKIDVEKYVSPDMDDDEPTIRAIMKSLQVGAHVHSDVLYFYVRFLKRLWAKTNKPFSEIPNVITRKVEVPQQGNTFDCAFFVLHMIKLFCEQAPISFKMENLNMFTENWFDPKDASALREDIWPIMCEELESHFGRPISRKLHDEIQNSPPLM
ncbi:ubiquitin-like-specific protease 1C [Apium graveolens]|uniref:ubiquitin-like-specific protease 1C n=1 Tax=Apium graveolens TaxID=4045 RepID=UPI003D7A31DE